MYFVGISLKRDFSCVATKSPKEMEGMYKLVILLIGNLVNVGLFYLYHCECGIISIPFISVLKLVSLKMQ